MIIPLFTPTDVPDASHRVTAPGGYESWSFEAEQPADAVRLALRFSIGSISHPGYLAAYQRYRRWPTRSRPPLPADYPSVSFAIYRGTAIVARVTSYFPTNQFTASADRPEIQIGPDSMRTETDGSLRVKLSGPRGFAADLRFTPKLPHPAIRQTLFPRSWSGADHQWIITNPICGVTGVVVLNDSKYPPPRVEFNGRGYHDHQFGTGPIGSGLRCYMRGRVLMNDHAVMFHYAQPETGPDEIHLLETEAMGSRELPVDLVQANWSRRTKWLLKYPDHLAAGPLRLHSPQVVETSTYSIRLIYAANVRGEAAPAICEIAYPNRLRWPILGRINSESSLAGF